MNNSMSTMTQHHIRPFTALLLTLLLTACTALMDRFPDPARQTARSTTATVFTADEPVSSIINTTPDATTAAAAAEIFSGTGSFINPPAAQTVEAADGAISLNFEGTPMQEVVQTILGDILQLNYVMNANISGTVSMRTTSPVSAEALIPLLDNLLRMNGGALVRTRNFYEVVPIGDSVRGVITPNTALDSTRGYQILIVPLDFIGANDMSRILEPLKSAGTTVIVDEFRNLLTLAGSQTELSNLLDTIAIFDIDQLQGKSVALFRLQHVDAQDIIEELGTIMGTNDDGPLAGVVRFSVLSRINTLLVTSTQEKYLRDAGIWISRLDQSENPQGVNMYVYYVQNGKAQNIAELLTQLFDGKRRRSLASLQADASRIASSPAASGDGTGSQSTVTAPVSSLDTGDVTIIADAENNSLLILASPLDYEQVEKAIERLDILPMQVLVEASIIEVTLGGELEYGLQWFFKNSAGRFNGTGGLRIPASGVVAGGTLSGTLADPIDFTYAVFDAAGARAILNMISSDSRIEVLSSPSLMVLDNQQATIRVGDQVPIRTMETNFVGNPVLDGGFVGNNVMSSIQYRDTGVTLQIKPRINNGGMVIMDITQRVDDVDSTTSSNIDSPTILQREITTSVAVQSGETIMLGGLIRDGKENANAGIPLLRNIPGVGALFSRRSISSAKTELLIMITPRAISNQAEAQDVTRQYIDTLRMIDFELGNPVSLP